MTASNAVLEGGEPSIAPERGDPSAALERGDPSAALERGDPSSALDLGRSLKASDRTDIAGEVEQRVLPGPKARVFTPQS